jgi:Ca2+-binding RTX toxin-like protein
MNRHRAAALLALALCLTIGDGAGGAASAAVECQGREATIVADRVVVRGTPGDDVIVDHEGAGLIEAGAGDDVICVSGRFKEVYSGGGDDLVEGGPEQDFVYDGAGDDTVRAGGGEDLLTAVDAGGDDVLRGGAGIDMVRFSYPFRRLQEAVRVDLRRGIARGHGRDQLAGFEQVEGTGRRDVILGDPADNLIDGIRGGDRIGGGAGDDIIFGARLLVTEAGPRDRYDGSDPALRGGSGDDRIFAGAGSDRLNGGAGDDHLDGGPPHAVSGDRGNGGGGRDNCTDLEHVRRCESNRPGGSV